MIYKNQKRWRVRVYRQVEDWIEIQADTAEEAEQEAAKRPFVLSVLSKSAISADKPLASTDPLGVLGDDDGD